MARRPCRRRVEPLQHDGVQSALAPLAYAAPGAEEMPLDIAA